MGCLCSKSDEPKIRIYYCIPPGDDFEYMRPQGTITLYIDRKKNIPIVDIRFDGWYENSVCQSILNRGNIFYYFKELHCRHLVLVRCLLMTVVLILYSTHIKKKMAHHNFPVHSCERLPHTAPQVLDSSSEVDLQFGRFCITDEECNLQLNAFCFQFWKI